MTITFDHDTKVIVYALEKIISYASENQDILLAQSVWWISSITGLQQRLVVHIDNLRNQSEVSLVKVNALSEGLVALVHKRNQLFPVATSQQAREISMVPRDNQEESRISYESRYIHPDRVSQVQDTSNDVTEMQCIYLDRVSRIQDTNIDVSDLDLNSSEPDRKLRVVESAKQFIRKSRKERKLFKKPAILLSRMRSEKVLEYQLWTEQRNRLGAIPKDTIVDYLENRKYDHTAVRTLRT